MVEIEMQCEKCEQIVQVKKIYLNKGYLDITLACGHHITRDSKDFIYGWEWAF